MAKFEMIQSKLKCDICGEKFFEGQQAYQSTSNPKEVICDSCYCDLFKVIIIN
jgi:formylmethanofuran dehydrogenase subunit E